MELRRRHRSSLGEETHLLSTWQVELVEVEGSTFQRRPLNLVGNGPEKRQTLVGTDSWVYIQYIFLSGGCT